MICNISHGEVLSIQIPQRLFNACERERIVFVSVVERKNGRNG